MSGVIKETENFVSASELFGGRRMILTGRGATALMMLFETLAPLGGRVILPAIACPSLLATVLLTGRRPVIIDVDRNLNIDPDRVREVIRPGDVVVAIHIFGIPCAIEELESICADNDAVLIEDAAQAIGGHVGSRPVGSFGVASILSFAAGKILPTNGGGAILTDDENLYENLREEVRKLPNRPDDLADKCRKLRDVLTDIFNEARRDNSKAASVWAKVYDIHPEIYSYSINPVEAETIGSALADMQSLVEGRLDGVRLYEKHIQDDGIENLSYPDGCVPYRFTFIMKELIGSHVQDLTEAIRNARPDGVHVSNLYLPLNRLASELMETTSCHRAEFAGMRVMNLWLDDDIPERDVELVAGIIGKWD